MLQNPYGREYSAPYQRFAKLLSPEEQQEIRETIINTHYTSLPVVDRVWNVMQRLGFKGGRVLEPGMGIGNFFGAIPEKLTRRSDWRVFKGMQGAATIANTFNLDPKKATTYTPS
jgi:hypothetical protein